MSLNANNVINSNNSVLAWEMFQLLLFLLFVQVTIEFLI